MADRRVVITGVGLATAAGVGLGPLWDSLIAGRSSVKPIGIFDASCFQCRVAGELTDFSARNYVPKDYRKAVKVMARDIELAVAAADQAFRDAGLKTRGLDQGFEVDLDRLGCNIGAGLICADLNELGAAVNTAVTDGQFDFKLWGSTGMGNLTPLWLLKYLPNMLSCHVTIIHGAQGPSNTITCGDASGLLSVGEAARLIARGGADVVIAGGAESKLNPMGLLRQGLLRRLCNTRNDAPQSACRPFDRQADGTVIGEGGGLLVLESLDHAHNRGARMYAEVAGFGAACDPMGMDVTRPTCGNLDLAVKAALKDASVEPGQVGLIVAHGTAVRTEDALEATAWRNALGGAADKAPALAVAGATGSLFAGAGGVSLGVAAAAIAGRTVPATVGFEQAAEGCGLNFAAGARGADIDCAVTGSFGIGGQSAAVVLRKI